MNTRIILFALLLFNSLSSAFPAYCNITAMEEEKLLSMDYDRFDQCETGWRKWAKSGCYFEMGALIDKYLDKNRNILSNWQMIGVTWHAGQMYAFDNRYEMAKSRFIHCINPNEPENAPILWNDYVYATLAFLNNDMAKLKFHRDKIADGPIFNGKKPNLDVADNLVFYFGQPYSVAYMSDRKSDS
ncbi:hypothetical protein [Legionella spiritensis]|uniref:hypothetical protein n=1 Tax=Legionella spiritensis TaxID=452 RepID=UPI000F71BBDB|nr:hypothetical protein [Legionella spiritensis]VEG92207.1 Uncharacterised protein [Legionella spiritensis]